MRSIISRTHKQTPARHSNQVWRLIYSLPNLGAANMMLYTTLFPASINAHILFAAAKQTHTHHNSKVTHFHLRRMQYTQIWQYKLWGLHTIRSLGKHTFWHATNRSEMACAVLFDYYPSEPAMMLCAVVVARASSSTRDTKRWTRCTPANTRNWLLTYFAVPEWRSLL